MGNKSSSLSNNGTSNSTSDSHHNNILTNQLTNNVSQTQITLYFPIDEHVQCGKIGRITIDRNDPTLVILPIAPEINKSSVFRLISTPTSVPKMLNYYCAKCNDRFCKIVPSNYYSTPQYFCYLFPIKNTVRIGSWHTYYEIGKFKIRDFFIPDNKSDKYWEYDQQSNYNGFVSMLCENVNNAK